MRRLLFASFILFLLILPVFAQEGEDLTKIGGDQAMREEVKKDVIGMITNLFGSWMFGKIEGAQGPTGLFSSEFLAAFFIVYFLLGSATSFQLTQGPAQFVGGGLPKILMSLLMTWLIWVTLGGFRFERLLVLMVPPMLVYYILSSVLKRYALLSSSLAQLLSIAAAIIAFLFYSPQLVDYLDGRFSYGPMDNLALGGGLFFAVYIFGFFLTKFTNEVISPLGKEDNAAASRKALKAQIDQLPDEQRKRVLAQLSLVTDLQQKMGGGG